VVLPLQPTEIDGSEYLVTAIGDADPPGYVRLSAAETYWVLRDWALHGSQVHVVELLRSLGAWRSAEPPRDLRPCIEELAERFDDYIPELAFYRRVRMPVALEFPDLQGPALERAS
jgi:hypothetical protein